LAERPTGNRRQSAPDPPGVTDSSSAGFQSTQWDVSSSAQTFPLRTGTPSADPCSVGSQFACRDAPTGEVSLAPPSGGLRGTSYEPSSVGTALLMHPQGCMKLAAEPEVSACVEPAGVHRDWPMCTTTASVRPPRLYARTNCLLLRTHVSCLLPRHAQFAVFWLSAVGI
jgi:hypothetical protein